MKLRQSSSCAMDDAWVLRSGPAGCSCARVKNQGSEAQKEYGGMLVILALSGESVLHMRDWSSKLLSQLLIRKSRTLIL